MGVVDPIVLRVLAAYARIDQARVQADRIRAAMRPADILYLAELDQAWETLPSRANIANPLWIGQRDVLEDQAVGLANAYAALLARVGTGGGSLPTAAPTLPGTKPKPWWDFELPDLPGLPGLPEIPSIDLGGAIPWVLLGLAGLWVVGSNTPQARAIGRRRRR